MRKTIGLSLLIQLFALAVCHAGQVAVEGVRLWTAPDHTRMVFDITGPVQHTLFTLAKPDRIVIDLSSTKLENPIGGLDLQKGLVQRIRSAPRHGKDLRVVLDLKQSVKPRSFVLKPNDTYGHRLVIDLYDKADHATPVKSTDNGPESKAREVVVAIDAGHGGDDPGAMGRRGTREKDVVLAIARRLEALVRKTPGMRPVMIRDGDYYIGLRKRIEIAREHKADLFVSIHADAYRNRTANGASVYALSQRGATNEAARWLAERENAADLIGGVSLDDKDELLASVLLDLSMNGTIEASLELADDVLGELKHVGPVHKQRVGQAGFVVLKSPDIPSILVETAFISNPAEERKLRSSDYQQKMARSVMRGIQRYLSQNPPPGTILALSKGRRHIIVRGDTLSAIAQQYDVSLDRLRVANGLDNDRLRVGDVLKIPSGGDS